MLFRSANPPVKLTCAPAGVTYTPVPPLPALRTMGVPIARLRFACVMIARASGVARYWSSLLSVRMHSLTAALRDSAGHAGRGQIGGALGKGVGDKCTPLALAFPLALEDRVVAPGVQHYPPNITGRWYANLHFFAGPPHH